MSNVLLLLKEWEHAAAQLKIWKDQEASLRAQLAEAASERNDPLTSGVENVEISPFVTLKIEHGVRYTVDKEKIDAALDAMEKYSPEGKFIADRVVKFTPELAVSEYKKISDPKMKKLLDDVLTVKPSTKSLEVKRVTAG